MLFQPAQRLPSPLGAMHCALRASPSPRGSCNFCKVHVHTGQLPAIIDPSLFGRQSNDRDPLLLGKPPVSIVRNQQVGFYEEKCELAERLTVLEHLAPNLAEKESPSRLTNIPSREIVQVRDSRRDSALPSLLNSRGPSCKLCLATLI